MKKLALSKETLVGMHDADAQKVVGGYPYTAFGKACISVNICWLTWDCNH